MKIILNRTKGLIKSLNIIAVPLGIFLFSITQLQAQTGYFDAPYTRYEADLGTLTNATATAKSYKQSDLQCEASNQVCVNLSNTGASVEWTTTADGDGLVVRYSIPDNQSGVLEVYADNVLAGTLNLTTYYSWEYLASNGNPNNVGVTNTNPRMRFDEVRLKLPSKILSGGKLKLVRQSGNITIDFAELESVPIAASSNPSYSVYTGDGSDLQTFIDGNGGDTIFLSPGVYNVNRELYFGVNNTVLKGAGNWYTEIHFINTLAGKGGLRANANDISFDGLYLSTVRNSRSNSYKAINGVFTSGSVVCNVWAEHFECGAWIGQYNAGGPSIADGFKVVNCRFRNNYADGINLCKGTSNTIVEHCNFRNNGDDDMAIWSSNGLNCQNNIFRYNTSENCWRSAGCAIYGGLSNQAHHLIIKDNLEVGIRVNNSFSGAGFNSSGMHVLSDITIIACGTFNDLYNSPVGAIDVSCTNIAGTRVKNVKFSTLNIVDSKNDAIYISKKSGEGFYNLIFESITVNSTGKEYPYNNAKGLNWGRGYPILFVGSSTGYATYCNMTYVNRGGNATVDVNTGQKGPMTWTNAGCGTEILTPLTGAIFGECDTLITITAAASPLIGAIDSIEFFVDGIKIGKDVTAPYSVDWKNFTLGKHTLLVKSKHSPSGNTISSTTEEITISYFKGLLYTATPPTIDGVADALWSGYTSASVGKNSLGNIIGTKDLSATFKINYDSTNLYLLVDITDDDLRNDGGNNWDNDALELFIDIGNDKNGSYGANDYSYNFVYNDATVYETKHNAITGVVFSQGAKTGGYIMEISIPWSTIGGSVLSVDSLLGFDLHVDDDDGGGVRDSKIAWTDCADVAWNNPSVFGTLQESGCSVSSIPTGFVSFTGSFSGGNALLNWSTYYKQSDSYFEVQRDVSQTGTYQVITKIVAGGNNGALVPVGYTDAGVPSGLLSYRISQVDVDGCILMTDTINLAVITGLINTSETQSFEFYPNPFLGSSILKLNSNSAAYYSINIKDMSGMLLSTKNNLNNGSYIIGENLAPGMYLLEVFDGNSWKTVKLIKSAD